MNSHPLSCTCGACPPLQDGERLRVPLTAMDAVQREMAATFLAQQGSPVAVSDAAGNPAGHRPGFLVPRPGSPAADARAVAEAVRLTANVLDYGTPPGAPADALAARDAAYAESLRDMTSAWRNESLGAR